MEKKGFSININFRHFRNLTLIKTHDLEINLPGEKKMEHKYFIDGYVSFFSNPSLTQFGLQNFL